MDIRMADNNQPNRIDRHNHNQYRNHGHVHAMAIHDQRHDTWCDDHEAAVYDDDSHHNHATGLHDNHHDAIKNHCHHGSDDYDNNHHCSPGQQFSGQELRHIFP